MAEMECKEKFEQFVCSLRNSIERLEELWNNLGLCQTQRSQREEAFFSHISNIMKEMEDEEIERRDTFLANITEFTSEIIELSAALNLNPFEIPEGLTILQLEKVLRSKFEHLVQEKNSRLNHLKKLKEHLHDLNSRLCTEPYYIPVQPGAIPSEQDLLDLKNHIDVLKAEKEKRIAVFKISKEKISLLFQELEIKATSSFEKSVMNEPEHFILSTENLNELKKLQEKLCLDVKRNEDKAVELRENLHLLWDRLQIDDVERDVFLKLNPGHQPRVLLAIRNEIERCNELKRHNIKSFIDKLREELKFWWEKCLVGNEQQEMFRAFYDDSYSENLLELHDLELQRLKNYHSQNEEIFNLIRKREQMWLKMLDFEKRANDPDRFTNRGGGLLQEEKDRNRLMKEFPKLEKQLEDLIMEWETQNNKVFLVNGQRYMDTITLQWEHHRMEKENAKLERQKAKARQLEQATGGGKRETPAKRKFPGTPLKTPNSMKRVRKALNTPCSVKSRTKGHSSLAMYRHSGGKGLNSSGKISKRRPSKGTPRFTPKRGVLHEPNMLDETFSQTTMCGKDVVPDTSVASVAASYTDFATSVISSNIFNSTEFPTCFNQVSPVPK